MALPLEARSTTHAFMLAKVHNVDVPSNATRTRRHPSPQVYINRGAGDHDQDQDRLGVAHGRQTCAQIRELCRESQSSSQSIPLKSLATALAHSSMSLGWADPTDHSHCLQSPAEMYLFHGQVCANVVPYNIIYHQMGWYLCLERSNAFELSPHSLLLADRGPTNRSRYQRQQSKGTRPRINCLLQLASPSY